MSIQTFDPKMLWSGVLGNAASQGTTSFSGGDSVNFYLI
jgi:hypothetical protein